MSWSWIDVGLGTIIGLFALMGLFQGIVRQLFRLGGLVLVIVYARFLAEPIGQWLSEIIEWNPLLVYYIALVGGAILVYFLCSFVGIAFHRRISKGGVTGSANRFLGMLLGAAKGLLIAFVIASLIEMVPAESMGGWPAVQSQVQDSFLLKRLHPLNPLPELKFLRHVNDYKELRDDELAIKKLKEQDAVGELYSHPKFRRAGSDAEVNQLWKEKEWFKLMVHRRILALVFDAEVRDILNRIDPKKARMEADEERKQRED